ncbi:PTS system mannose/fructose/sorbose family transporter subunit IID [Gemmatimonadota bacterium]
MSQGLVRSWLRTLLIQASWSYERMIGVGIAFATEPILRRLPGGAGGDRYRQALGRATAQFNSHPYFAGAAVGALARAEHQGLPADQMARFRTALAGPLGSVGDKLVWAGTVPIASAIGLMLAVIVSPVVAVVVLLAVHNTVNISLRVWALRSGWHGGLSVATQLDVPLLKWGLKLAGPATAFALGAMLPIVTAWLVSGFEPNAVTAVGVVAAVGILLARWLWPTLGGIRYGLVVVVLAALAGWI